MFGMRPDILGPDHKGFASISDRVQPWGGSPAESDRARDAGIDHIGHGHDAATDATEHDAGIANPPDEVNAGYDTDLADADDNDFDGDQDAGDGGTDAA
jgi:hypothetical protein